MTAAFLDFELSFILFFRDIKRVDFIRDTWVLLLQSSDRL